MALYRHTTVIQTTIILESHSDWHNWLFMRKSSAQVHDLWQYVDPSQPEPQAFPPEPVEPALNEYKTEATRPSHLSPDEREDYKWEYHCWELEHAKWQKKLDALRTFDLEIVLTVATKYFHLLWDKKTSYARLVALKAQLCPIESTRSRELAARYAEVKRAPRGGKVAHF